jgi:aminoglycoside phosphotransferase (APT) family kinase protein
VIDWTNAARGNPLSDVALTYVLLTCPEMPGSRVLQLALQPARGLLARSFVRRFRGPEFDVQLAVAAELKALDKNMTPPESEACLELARSARQRAARAS